MRGGGGAAQEGKTGAAKVAGVENRGGGGGAPREEEDGRPQVGDWVQEESEMLIGALIRRRKRPVGGNRGGSGAARTPRSLEVEDDWWTGLEFVKTSGA